MPGLKQKHSLLAILLFVTWVAATAYAFWWFEFKNLRPFDNDSLGQIYKPDLDRIYSAVQDALPAETGAVTVVHFWNPDCYCNRFNIAHLKQIMDEYRLKGVRFYLAIAQPKLSDEQVHHKLKDFGDIPILSLDRDAMKEMIPSTPAAAVIRPGQGIAYFGPYSEGAMCSRQSGGFVESVLDATLSGNTSAQLNTLAFGCYCDW